MPQARTSPTAPPRVHQDVPTAERPGSAGTCGSHATLLVDIFFTGRAARLGGRWQGGQTKPHARRRKASGPVHGRRRSDLGQNCLAGREAEFPTGEWGWKIQFLNERVGFVSLENLADGAILKTVDSGTTWTRKPVNDPQDNANLEGIGFVDENLGWIRWLGGQRFQWRIYERNARRWGNLERRESRRQAPESFPVHSVSRRLVGYASGDTVYKYSAAPIALAPQPLTATLADADEVRTRLPVRIPIDPYPGAPSVRVDIWDRFGEHLATPLDEAAPQPGPREVTWSGETESGGKASGGLYIYRITVGDWAESRTLRIEE